MFQEILKQKITQITQHTMQPCKHFYLQVYLQNNALTKQLLQCSTFPELFICHRYGVLHRVAVFSPLEVPRGSEGPSEGATVSGTGGAPSSLLLCCFFLGHSP